MQKSRLQTLLSTPGRHQPAATTKPHNKATHSSPAIPNFVEVWRQRLTLRMRSVLVAVGLVLTVSSSLANAQVDFGQDWKDMSPDNRDQLRQEYFSNLPQSQQQRLRQNQQKFQALPGNQKRTLCQKFQNQNGYLPPACQSLLGP